MHSHPIARLKLKCCLRFIIQHLEHGYSLAELAAENGISLRRAYRLLARYRSCGPASLVDRLSFRRLLRRSLLRSTKAARPPERWQASRLGSAKADPGLSRRLIQGLNVLNVSTHKPFPTDSC